MVTKIEELDVDEKVKVQEAILPGPHGQQEVIISVEEDLHVHGKIRKDEIEVEGKHGISQLHDAQALVLAASSAPGSSHINTGNKA